jgi:hypothetical protein
LGDRLTPTDSEETIVSIVDVIVEDPDQVELGFGTSCSFNPMSFVTSILTRIPETIIFSENAADLRVNHSAAPKQHAIRFCTRTVTP